MRHGFVLILALVLVPSFQLLAQTETYPEELQVLRAAFEKEMKSAGADIEKLNLNYRKALERLSTQQSETGDLEKVLVVKKEIENFGDGIEYTEAGFSGRISDDSSLATLQRTYQRSRVQMDEEFDEKRGKLVSAYRGRLVLLERNLTRDQRIEEAILVKKEREGLPAQAAALGKEPSSSAPFKARLHFVGKAEIEVYLNGREVRYRNETDQKHYVDVTSSPLDVSVGDVVIVRMRGDAVFRGAIFGFAATDDSKHIQFPASSFRLLEVGDAFDAARISSKDVVEKSLAKMSKSQPDGDMTKMWAPHGIKHCQFFQPPAKSQWTTFGSVITEEMIEEQDP